MTRQDLNRLLNLELGLALAVNRPKTEEQRCHVCFEPRPLTREHVPARAAYNSQPRMWESVKVRRESEAAIVAQRIHSGHWVRSLCGRCNSTVCKPYADEYTSFVKGLLKRPTILGPDGLFAVRMSWNKLLLAKQIATMILAIESPEFVEGHESLRGFVLDRNAIWESQFRVFAFMVENDHTAGTITRWHGRSDLRDGDWDFAGGEISAFPFGFVYAERIGSAYQPQLLTDITSWFESDDDETPESFGIHLTGVGSTGEAVGIRRRGPQVDRIGQ